MIHYDSTAVTLTAEVPNMQPGGGTTAGPPSPGATPELDSVLLFGTGLIGVGGYLLRRRRAGNDNSR